ncbi:glycosyltransferase involved in cell wall biosynthesis [Sphingomonas jinjuensis]|uniref:Glycosyltransferase involved in cell wall biosynthesis n=1 Tax=Sphingomonas jinjuensis TaxID=535907 RepID=A0A840FGM8_9SPHN|nr:glycosyltransferase [Sphingomonas jinjuensis]MBB4154874.1 glycosyltransferase involved in cell wall biosynthesis [Sphingomonas jinjuensis]
MRIAILAHVRQRIAQPFAGGMESHCWHLADGLQRRGHDVVLFASGDSDPRFAIDPVVAEHYERTFPWAEHRGTQPLIAHLDAGYAAACDRIAAGGFDVVHNNSLHRFPLEQCRTAVTPTVTSLHVPPYDALHWFVAASPSPRHHLTVTSTRQLAAWWPKGAPAEASVLHNGIDPARWPFGEHGDGTAAWCGRITPNKGPHLAAAAARRAGIPLTLFGAIEDPDYWQAEVAPLLGDGVAYGGHLAGDALAGELGRASLFVFTPCWDEPFGLVAAEAMACGLPVAAFDMGAAREVIGEAGVFAPPCDVAALADAMVEALAIPRRIARNRVLRLFTHDRWLDRCEALYRSVAAATATLAA